jgi:hypothetical protein
MEIFPLFILLQKKKMTVIVPDVMLRFARSSAKSHRQTKIPSLRGGVLNRVLTFQHPRQSKDQFVGGGESCLAPRLFVYLAGGFRIRIIGSAVADSGAFATATRVASQAFNIKATSI